MANLKQGFIDHKDLILGGIAVALHLTAFGMSMKAGSKVDEILYNHKRNIEDLDEYSAANDMSDDEYKTERKYLNKETVKDLAKAAGPAVAIELLATGCSIASLHGNAKHIAMLQSSVGLASASIRSLATENQSLRRELPKEKVEKIQQETVKQDLKHELYPSDGAPSQQYQPYQESLIVETGLGHTLYRLYGLYFYGPDTGSLVEVVSSKLEKKLRNEMTLTLGDFYDELNLSEYKPRGWCDEVGWEVNSNDRVVISVLPTEVPGGRGALSYCGNIEVNASPF